MAILPVDPTQLPPLPRPQDSRNAASPFAVPPAMDEDDTATVPPAAAELTPTPAPGPRDGSARGAGFERAGITLALTSAGDSLQPFVLYPAPLGAVPIPSSIATPPDARPGDAPVAAVAAASTALDDLGYRNGSAALPATDAGYTGTGTPVVPDADTGRAGSQIDERV